MIAKKYDAYFAYLFLDYEYMGCNDIFFLNYKNQINNAEKSSYQRIESPFPLHIGVEMVQINWKLPG